MSSDAGTAAAPTPPPVPVRFADIHFVDSVLDPNDQNPKRRRVVILAKTAAAAQFLGGWP